MGEPHRFVARIEKARGGGAFALRLAPDAKRAFEALSFSHKREYVRWIDGARRGDTRARRISVAVEKLSRGEGLR